MQVNGNPIQIHVKLTLFNSKKSAYSFDITETGFEQLHLLTTICTSIRGGHGARFVTNYD